MECVGQQVFDTVKMIDRTLLSGEDDLDRLVEFAFILIEYLSAASAGRMYSSL